MEISKLAKEIYDEISEITVIDAHEHLPSEKEYLSFQYSGPNIFAGGYIQHDLESAGMDLNFKKTLRNGGERPVEIWWPKIKPYWEYVKNTSYAKALRITVKDVFDVSEINDNSIKELAGKIKADNIPGLYQRILQNRCKIKYVITCGDKANYPDDPILYGITPLLGPCQTGDISGLHGSSKGKFKNLEDVANCLQRRVRKDIENNVRGFKIRVSDYNEPDMKQTESEFKEALKNPDKKMPRYHLRNYLFEKALDVVAENNLPVAVHTGYWGDFRKLDPKLMFSFALRRRDVQFDMFHLGMPMIRDAILIGKNLPNVSLNLTWCPIISQLQTAQALNEMIDLVPVNKIIAFGGDYRVAVQKVYGHLVMAKEVVAYVLAERIKSGEFDREYAIYLAKLWFYENPLRIYKLNCNK